MRSHSIAGVLAAGWLVALGSLAGDAHAALPSPLMPVSLGAAGSFGVLGASTVTSAGLTVINGNLGVSPGTAITGFGPGTYSGTLDSNDPLAAQAHADLGTAYGDAAGLNPATPIPLATLSGTLGPGVYGTPAALTLPAAVTLDGQGDPGAVFIFQAGSTLTTSPGSQVNLINGARACNVFWAIGSSATLNGPSSLAGTILANTSISMTDGVTVDGGALALGGAVTLIHDTASAAKCAGSLSNTAPPITPFSAKLTGIGQSVTTSVGGWDVIDARGSNGGYSVTVAASPPTVNGSTAAAGTGGSLTLTPATASAATGNPATAGPLAQAAQTLRTTPSTIENAPPGAGQGEWDFPADSGSTKSLSVFIPGDASPGVYSSTLTFTTAPPAG